MCRYHLTEKAISDLTEIWNYTFDKWSENQADKYYYEILNLCQVLAENSQLGKSYNKLIPKLRGAKINRHIIFYREKSKSVIEIERILHEQMDLKIRF